jgi:hypothetical protein
MKKEVILCPPYSADGDGCLASILYVPEFPVNVFKHSIAASPQCLTALCVTFSAAANINQNL